MKTKLLLFFLIFELAKLSGQNYYKICFTGNPETVFVENQTQGTSVSLQGKDTLYLKLKVTSLGETESAKHKLTIYPNPMDQSCNFDFENTKYGRVNIQLYNVNDSLVHEYSRKLPQGKHHFKLSGVPAGVYVIYIKTETYHVSDSFVSIYKSKSGILLLNENETSLKTDEGKNVEESNINLNDDIPLRFRTIIEMDYAISDQLKFIGYSSGFENDTVFASPTGDQTINFIFCTKPAQPSAISGNNNPCQDATGLSFSVTSVSGETYTWTVPSDWTITSGQNTNSITVNVGTASGSITVSPSNTCGIGTARTLAVTTQTVPTQLAAGTHMVSQTQIVWNWNSPAGATGYKYNTVNYYATASDNATSATYTQTGLNCGTQYKLYVWAYNTGGNSTSLLLIQNTEACTSDCDSPVTFTYNGSQVTYGKVTGANKRCWLDRNLGASQVASSSTDAASYGDLFQWGRLDDGHQDRTSPTTTTLSSSDNPGYGNYILRSNSPCDWRSSQNPNLWQGVSGTNNPCPSGYRLPTEEEWDTERLSWSTKNDAGAFASPLKLPMAGYRNRYNGLLFSVGSDGRYWSSTVSGIFPANLYFNSSDAFMGYNYRASGFSVRCIKE